MDLSKIHDAYVRNDTFSAGFELGALLNRVVNSINQDEREEEDEDEEVQEEECDEECEESSKEEESCEYYEKYREANFKIAELTKLNFELEIQIGKLKECEKTAGTINETKRCIFELQDLLMRLLKFGKINKGEVEHVINILRNTGVDKSDISVICKGLIR